MNIEEIKKLKDYYVNDLYAGTRKEQRTDQEYRNDTFAVDEIRSPHKVWRSGMGARMVDAPAEQIITSNPQFFANILKGEKGAESRIGEMVNQEWIPNLRLGSPNPFKEILKNTLGYGESYIRLSHNQSWVTKPISRTGLPVLFLIPNPMVIYGSPEEDDCGWIPNVGVPNRVIVFYERQYRDVIYRYPSWTNPKQKDEKVKIEWVEYWDKDSFHFEADGETVREDKNIYGFTPFVRGYSGFGTRSPDGALESLIVSDIRLSRDLIKQECITRSNIASIEHLFAHRPKTIIAPKPGVSEAELQELQWGAYDLNQLTYDPNVGAPKFEDEQYSPVPPEMYQNLANLRSELAQRNPFIMAGFPLGASGRQQDLSQTAAMRRYDTVIETVETRFATAFNMALKICDKVPTLPPDGLRKNDLKTTLESSVKLRASDPIEDDRLATLGSRLLMNNEIDPITNLVQFKGYTEDEARQILIDVLKWKVLLGSPDIAELIGLRAAEKSGMAEDLQAIQQRRQQLEGMAKTPPKTTQERVLGEVQTQTGREMGVEAGRGARRPPERFTRS